MPCWECQPYLDEKSVMTLLREIAGVLTTLPYHEHHLDSNWSKGVRAYDWVRNYLIQSEGDIPGLTMASKGLDFVFAMHKVPIQFSKDDIDAPKKKHRLLRNRVEHEQLALFGETEPEQDITWRVLAEPYFIEDEEEGGVPSWVVALVGFNAYGAIVSQVLHHAGISVPVMTSGSTEIPAEAVIDDVPVLRRKPVGNDKEEKDNAAL